jgi:hypothetical protein
MKAGHKTATVRPARTTGRKPQQIAADNHTASATAEPPLDPEVKEFLDRVAIPALVSMFKLKLVEDSRRAATMAADPTPSRPADAA